MLSLKYIPYLECFWNKKKLFELTFFVTNKCNFKCPFCFNDSKAEDISIKQIEEIAEKQGKFCRLLISGGEPFLRNDLSEICRIFIEKCNVLHISIPTNGYMTERISSFVDEICAYNKNVTINISLSVDEIYNKRDELVNAQNSWYNLKSTAMELKRKNFKNLLVGTITTQCPQNELRLYKIFNVVKDWKLDYFSFNRARGTMFNENIYRRFYKFLLRQNIDKTKVPFFKLRKKLLFNSVLNSSPIPCYSMDGIRKVIASDGKEHICETIMFGGKCPCWHECDLETSAFFNIKYLIKEILNG